MVIITGATKGIGRAIALQFASRGYNLAICSRNQLQVKELADFIENQYGVKVLWQAVDLSLKGEVLDFARFCLDSGQPIHALVNNAGVFVQGTLQTEEDSTHEYLFNLNVSGVYYLTKALINKFLEQRSGHIFNMASIASFMPLWNCLSYTMTKHALLGFSRCLREELKHKGVKVTTLMPGATDSASWEGSGVPAERLMSAEEIAAMVWAAFALPGNAVVEDMVIRPQLGDL